MNLLSYWIHLDSTFVWISLLDSLRSNRTTGSKRLDWEQCSGQARAVGLGVRCHEEGSF